MNDIAALFKVLGDPTRLRLAVILAGGGEFCVCNLITALNEPQYKISRHLSLMRSAGLIEARREGTWMHYRLCEPTTELERCLWNCLQSCLNDHQIVKQDKLRLQQNLCQSGVKTDECCQT